MLGFLGNILTANEKNAVRENENFFIPFQMQLSWKPRIFSDFFVPFLETTLNFQNYKKKMIVIPTLFRKLQTVHDLVRPLSKKYHFKIPFDIWWFFSMLHLSLEALSRTCTDYKPTRNVILICLDVKQHVYKFQQSVKRVKC